MHVARGANERRIARMGVWIDLAEASTADHVRFVFYWIADDKCLPPWLRIDAARHGIETEHG